MRALQLCAASGCPRPAAPGRRGRCIEHSRSYPAYRRERAKAFARAGGRCVDCGAPAVDADHAVRAADGGSDDALNLTPRCERCHAARHRTGA